MNHRKCPYYQRPCLKEECLAYSLKNSPVFSDLVKDEKGELVYKILGNEMVQHCHALKIILRDE